MSSIRIDGLVVELGDHRILDGIDLEVAGGSWVSIVGPNGAGKTTLVRTVAGLVKPHAGRVEVDGVPTHSLHARARARLVALVPQSPVIPVGVSVLDYALLGRTPHVSYFGRETAADVAECHAMLERLGVAELAGRPVETLSGGERQRVVLARALLQRAPIVLLDEPTTALDIGHQQDVLELVEELRHEQGLTVVSTMHDLTLAGLFADELVLLDAGRVAERGPASAVLTEAHLREHFGARVSVLQGVDGPVVVPARIPRVATTRVRVGQIEGGAVSDEEPPIEDPRPDTLKVAKSLVLVNTGDGKGKSTAAFGVILRAVAQGWKVAVVQFLKSGEWQVGEEKTATRQLGVDWFAIGEGFTWDSTDLSEDEARAQAAWARAQELIRAGEHRLVVLDEITYPMNWGWIDSADVVETIRSRPERVNVIATGRDAPAELVDLADTVTEMRSVKHAYDSGIAAKKGIDY